MAENTPNHLICFVSNVHHNPLVGGSNPSAATSDNLLKYNNNSLYFSFDFRRFPVSMAFLIFPWFSAIFSEVR